MTRLWFWFFVLNFLSGIANGVLWAIHSDAANLAIAVINGFVSAMCGARWQEESINGK